MILLATWALTDAAIARIPMAHELGANLGLNKIGLTTWMDPIHVWINLNT
jgi:hypothetical protein